MAVIVGATALQAGQAWAGDIIISNTNYAAHVYGNSNGVDPTTSVAGASNNSLTITGTSYIITGIAYGASSMVQGAFNNTVLVDSDAVVDWNVVGGSANAHDVIGNSVTIGGNAQVGSSAYGGQTLFGDANGNSVTISGNATIGLSVFGGFSDSGAAMGNSVTISGGTINSSLIVGGDGGMMVTGNTVTISGAPVFTSTPELYGGRCHVGGCSDIFTGNTLNLKTAGLAVASLQNFEYLNFYLPTSLASGQTMLSVSGIADLTNGSGGSSIVNVGINGAASALAAGDTITLIHAGTLVTDADLNDTATGSGMLGVTLSYVFDIGIAGNNLTATVQGSSVTEESKALSEGVVSGASFVNQGADLAAGKGMANAISAAEAGWSSFGAVSGGSIRTETGSHVDVEGVSLMAGLSGDADLSIGRLTAGVFAEYGSGAYDTFNGFSSGDVRGQGDSTYIGGGLLGHMDFDAAGPGHAYAEASVRFGNANNSFSSADLVSGGVAAGYDTASLYAGASAAVGYVWNLSEATTIDVSGKVLWSRLGSDTVQLTTGETVEFDAVTSERTRLGARVSYALSEQVTPYAGAAWEHEFDGKAGATTNGLALDAPSMGGDTGILEAGLTLTPSDDLPLSIDLGLQGFVGQREGIAGSFQARLTF